MPVPAGLTRTELIGIGVAALYMLAFIRSRKVRRLTGRLIAGIFRALWRIFRWCWHQARARRRFTPERRDRRDFRPLERAEIIRRAGGRCEHIDPDGTRCPSIHGPPPHTILEADHVIPWAIGGPTRVTNAQALCRWHNGRKTDRVPTQDELAALYLARRDYYRPRPIPDPARYLR